MDHYTDTLFTKLTLKILAAYTLFELGNYSKYQYVFDELSQEEPRISSYLISMLSDIIRNIPSEEMRAKNALIKIAAENSEDLFRYYVISDLAELYGEEMIPFFTERFVMEEDIAVIILLYESLRAYKDERINSAFKTKLPSINEGLTREQILRRILSQYSTISDFKYVLDYQNSEIDPENKATLNFLINDYKPPKPSSTTSPLAMLDELITLTDSVYKYNWITNKGIYISLSQKLENAKKNLEKGDDKSAKNVLEAFRNEVEAQKEKHITIDGYKLLYYYSGYIIERL